MLLFACAPAGGQIQPGLGASHQERGIPVSASGTNGPANYLRDERSW